MINTAHLSVRSFGFMEVVNKGLGLQTGCDCFHFTSSKSFLFYRSHRNTHRNGEWIFQIGGAGVKRNHEPVAPEKARVVRRQASIINVQEVNCKRVCFFWPPSVKSTLRFSIQ